MTHTVSPCSWTILTHRCHTENVIGQLQLVQNAAVCVLQRQRHTEEMHNLILIKIYFTNQLIQLFSEQ